MLIEKTRLSNHECNSKEAVLSETYKLSDLIVFEIANNNKRINEIPNNIRRIENKKYSIVAAIEYVPGLPGGLGHYKAHCKSGAKWYCYDDSLNKV